MMNEFVPTIMTANVITLSPSDTLGHAREIFMTKRIHHLPVVEGEKKKLVGMITSWDIFKLGLSAVAYQDMRVLGIVTTYDTLRYEYNKEYPENLDKFIPDNMR